MNDQALIKETLEIFTDYPPLTSRLIAQVSFMKRCFKHRDVASYLSERGSKYDAFPSPAMEGYVPPHYFNI